MTDPLARMIGRSPTGEDHIHDMGAAAYHKAGFYGEHIADMADDPWFQQAAINRMNKKYGKRNSGLNTTKDAR